jgi:hypothetical protein
VDIYLNPKKITIVFVYAAVLLLLANIIAQYMVLALGDDRFFGFVPMFHFNEEKNAPTYFSSFILAFASVLLAVIAAANKGKRYFWHWAGMSLIFLFISFDELVAVHEKFTRPIRDALQLGGLLYYAWVIPYMLVVVMLALVYFRFIFNLPSKTRFRFILSAGLFMTGAVVAEMFGGSLVDEMGTSRNFPCAILMTLEELLEMGGTILFIYALFSYMQDYLPDLRVRLVSLEQYQPVEAAHIKVQAVLDVSEPLKKIS